MLTILPCRCVIISRPTAWQSRNAPRRFTPIMVSQSSSVTASMGPRRMTPMAFTRMSIRPHALRVAATSASMDARCRISSGMASASCPWARIWAAARSPWSGVLFATTTFAPADARPSATASPIPREPPATSATFPDRSKRSRAPITASFPLPAGSLASFGSSRHTLTDPRDFRWHRAADVIWYSHRPDRRPRGMHSRLGNTP